MAGLGILVVAAAVLWLTTAFAPPPRVSAPSIDQLAPDARSATDFALLSCVHIRLANQAVQADAPSTTARRELAAGRVLAAEALRRDSRFAGLSGGIAALDEAVRTDDARGAAVGLRVTSRECSAVER